MDILSKHSFSTSSTQAGEMASQEIDAHPKQASTASLSQIFSKDVLESKERGISSSQLESSKENKTSSFWGKLLQWWWQSNIKEEQASTPAASVSDSPKTEETELMSSIPSLEEPIALPADLIHRKLPPCSNTTRSGEKECLLQSQLMEGLSQMSDRTIEQIVFMINMAQIELEKENAQVAESTFSKYQRFKSLQTKLLGEVKDALAKDEQIASYLKKARTITALASLVCGIALAASTCGIIPPMGLAMEAALAPLVGRSFTAVAMGLSSAAVPVTVGLAGLTSASNLYFKRRIQEDKAQHAQLSHKDKYYHDRLDDSRERLFATAETDTIFKERIMNLLKRFQKMTKLILEK